MRKDALIHYLDDLGGPAQVPGIDVHPLIHDTDFIRYSLEESGPDAFYVMITTPIGNKHCRLPKPIEALNWKDLNLIETKLYNWYVRKAYTCQTLSESHEEENQCAANEVSST